MTPRALPLAVAAVTVLMGPVAVPARAAGELPRCRVVDFSPEFERDGTAFCARVVLGVTPDSYGVLHLYRTTDKGRSWQRRPAAGLDRLPNGGNGEDVEQLVVSPRFPRDRQVAVQLGTSGLHVSTDAGASFRPLAPTANGQSRLGAGPPGLVGYQEILPVSPEAATAFGYAGPVPQQILGAGPVPVVAAGGQVQPAQFLVHPATGPARHRFLVGTTVSGAGAYHTHLYACDATLTCLERLTTAPLPGGPVRFWLAPDFDRSRTVFAVLAEGRGVAPLLAIHTVAYWSRDGGRTFRPFPSVSAVLDKIYDQKVRCFEVGIPRVGLSFDRGRHYLRVSDWVVVGLACPSNPSPPAPPGDAVYESRDAGRSWRLIASGLSALQPGRRGSIPWSHTAGPEALRGDLAVRAGRIFVVARANGYEGVFCSVDGGRSWGALCAR